MKDSIPTIHAAAIPAFSFANAGTAKQSILTKSRLFDMKNYLFVLLAFVAFSCKKTDEPQPVLSTEKSITSFVITSLTPNAEGTIDQAAKSIEVVVPVGTDISNLTPTILASEKASIDPGSGTPLDFTKKVVYTVTAEDGTSQLYNVSVHTAPLVLLYDSGNGDATVVDAEKLAPVSTASIGAGWSSVLNIGGYEMFLYNKVSGQYKVVQLPSMNELREGNMGTDLEGGLSLGVDTMLFFTQSHSLVYLNTQTLETVKTFPNINNSDLDKHVLAGDGDNEQALYSSVSGDIINVDNNTLEGDYVTTIATGFTRVLNMNAGTLLFYNASTGLALKASDVVPYPGQGEISLGAGWSHIVNIGLNKILFLNAQSGASKVSKNGDLNSIVSAAIPAPSGGGSWTHVCSSASY